MARVTGGLSVDEIGYDSVVYARIAAIAEWSTATWHA